MFLPSEPREKPHLLPSTVLYASRATVVQYTPLLQNRVKYCHRRCEIVLVLPVSCEPKTSTLALRPSAWFTTVFTYVIAVALLRIAQQDKTGKIRGCR